MDQLTLESISCNKAKRLIDCKSISSSQVMGGIKAWKKAHRATNHDPPGVTKPTTDQQEQGLSKRKKKKNAAKKLKDFWEKKKQQQKNLSPNADDVSLKDAAMQLPTRRQQGASSKKTRTNEVLSPRTAPESIGSPEDQLHVLPNSTFAESLTADQIFRRQQEAPGKKGLEIMEVVVPSNGDMGNISPISIDRSAFLPQSQHQQEEYQRSGMMQSHFEQPSTHYTEGVGIELELEEALQLPALDRRNRGGGRRSILDDLASETSESMRGRSRERAHNVSARDRRRVRPTSGGRARHEAEQVDSSIYSTAIDLTDIENEDQAMKLELGLNDPSNAFDDIANPLTSVLDVFGSLTDLLKGDDRSDGVVSANPGSFKGEVDVRDDLTMRGTVDVMKKESTKGAPFDPIDLTECDYRLFVRKPVEAINIGFGTYSLDISFFFALYLSASLTVLFVYLGHMNSTVEDADDAYDEMIEKSNSIVTKATHRMLGRNNTWYLG